LDGVTELSLREKSGKPTGGQKGHKGHTLKMSEKPDETVVHETNYCRCCGKELGGVSGTVHEKR
jgi:transposase